ncbi:MAG TPA: apolipoprotein N-acyltransferase [Spirochaetota bacterium]|nr:apolipoprotein N-acyltransferase [Spirochaetota bacterium]
MEKIIKNQITEVRFFYKIFLYIFLGALWSFSNVGYSFGLLTWFTFVPFLFFIKYENFKWGLLFSWIFGFSAYTCHFWWMVNPFYSYMSQDFLPIGFGFIGIIVGSLATLLVAAYHGLMYLIIYGISKFAATKKNGDIFYLIMPLIVTAVDYFFPKLWFDQIGYSQYIFFNFSQIADLFGVPLITFIVISSNASIIILIESILYKKNLLFSIFLFSFVILIIIIGSIYGDYKKNEVEKSYEDFAKIGIVQGNYSGLDKKIFGKFDEMLTTYNDMTKTILDNTLDLVVWPESAIPTFFDSENKDFTSVKNFNKVPLLFGTHIIETPNEESRKKDNIYNSLILLSEDGKKLDYYYKRKLLMFVEGFEPKFLNIFMGLYGLTPFSSGEDNRIMSLNKLKIAANICYEDIIPTFVRKSLNFKDEKANILINCTNDSWFGKSIEPNMHLHIAGFRAIENRISLVRSTCTGYSAVFSPKGELLYKSGLLTKEAKSVNVPLLSTKTVYNTFGWFFVYLLGIIIILIFVYAVFRKIKFEIIKSKMLSENHHKKDLYKIWYD